MQIKMGNTQQPNNDRHKGNMGYTENLQSSNVNFSGPSRDDKGRREGEQVFKFGLGYHLPLHRTKSVASPFRRQACTAKAKPSSLPVPTHRQIPKGRHKHQADHLDIALEHIPQDLNKQSEDRSGMLGIQESARAKYTEPCIYESHMQ